VLLPAILVAILGVLGPGPADPVPTPPTSTPDSPAAALSLEREPSLPPPPLEMPPSPGKLPLTPPPLSGPGLAALAVGFAILATRTPRTTATTRTIRRSLQDSLFSDVGHGDLTSIADTLRGLRPVEATAVVAGLSDHELGVWMRELNGWVGGFNAAEQAGLFDDLATRLGPSQLARIAEQGRMSEVIAAAREATAPGVRIQLALLLWTTRSPGDDGWSEIVTLLESSPPAVLGSALAGRPAEEVVFRLFGHHQSHRDNRPRIRLDAVPRFLAVAEQIEDAGLRAEMFAAAAAELAATSDVRVTGPGERDEVLSALGSLLRRDPAGTISDLNHRVDPHANVLSSWIKQMIVADRLDELDVLLADLIGSNRLNHYTHQGSDPADPYPNASNLGYYVGAYGLAIDSIADDTEDRITLVSQLFSILTGLVPGPGRTEVRLPTGPLVDRHAASVVAGLRAEAASLKQALWGLAKPRDEGGSLWNGPGTTQFQDAWEEVMVVR